MRRSNVVLRLQASLLEQAKRVADQEGVALNQFINVADAEKLSGRRAEDYFRVRAERGNVRNPNRILQRAGRGHAPVRADEITGV